MPAPVFRNPVAVHMRVPAVEALREVLANRAYVLVTSRGWMTRGVPDDIAKACGQSRLTIGDVVENPTLQRLAGLDEVLAPLRGRGVVVVALGGGSVMDAAKAVAVGLAHGAGMATVAEAARGSGALPSGVAPSPLICVPTTAGTGSEVTRTATMWDAESGAKYSLADDGLYPAAAILDPVLTHTMPPPITLATGLDALSHAMEAVWNVHHSPLADGFAAAAIARIRRYLPVALTAPDDEARAEMQTAALLAGLAISTTRTALAHSISYPLTARFGLRHGLACSFTLADVAEFNLAARPDRLRVIADAFDVPSADALPSALRAWLAKLGVYEQVRATLAPEAVAALGVSVITPGRADNNVRAATAADAHAILYAALDEQTWSRTEAPAQAGRVVWITGLSGAGKTMLARAVTAALRGRGRKVVLLDGDELRAAIAGKVGHTDAERRELAHRYATLCRFLSFEGVDVVCATMSLYHDVHTWNRAHIPGYLEVYLRVDLDVLIRRDPKGLYGRALRGEIRNIAGIDQAFEAPLAPHLTIDNNADREDTTPLVQAVLDALAHGAEPSNA